MLVRLTWVAEVREGPGDLALLTPAERARRDGLVRPADRARFTLGTALLRRSAGHLLGVSPAAVDLRRTCPRCGRPHGRPLLPGTGLSASISHSAERVVVAVAAGAEVGVDVERIDPEVGAEVAGSVLGPGEAVADPAEVFRYWTRKEAVVKATGDGLTVPLPEVLVTAAAEPPALRGYPGRRLTAVLRDLDAGAGYAAALAVLTAGPVEIESRWLAGSGI